jgi:NADPH:quinone reductase-like Zn-dependent oxidoreductase
VKQVVITRHGPPEVLVVRDAPAPGPGPGEVAVLVRAAGVNFSDLLARQGLAPDAPKPPCVVGYEVAGTVDATGPDVPAPRVGDAVIALTRFGGQSERVVVPAARVLPLPRGWSHEEGAALPVTYLSAHHMLARVAAARAGETVLVHAAAGGLGLAAAELGRIFGWRIIGLASPAKHDALRRYGVTPVDSRDPRWWSAVRRIAPEGVDVVLDPVGGASWRRGYALLKPAGRLVCCGVASLAPRAERQLLRVVWRLLRFPRFGPRSLMDENKSVAGVNMGHLWDAEALIRPQLDAILTYAWEGRIRPSVDRAFRFSEAAAAHRYIHERKNVGKVVLVPDSVSPQGGGRRATT